MEEVKEPFSPPSFDPSGDGGAVPFLVVWKRACSCAVTRTVGGAALADRPFFGNLVKQFWNSASFFVFLALVLVNDIEGCPVAIVCDLHSSAPFVVITALRVVTSACLHDAEHAASAFCQSSHVFALIDSEFNSDALVPRARFGGVYYQYVFSPLFALKKGCARQPIFKQ